MVDVIDDQLIKYTKSRLDNGVLTYSFRKGQLIRRFRSRINALIDEVDDRLDGIKFRKIKPSSKTDVIIGYGDLPSGAISAAVWNDKNWEIRLPVNYFSTVAFRHELGHVLGLNHADMGSKSLMAPGWNGYSDFSKADLNALRTVWGK